MVATPSTDLQMDPKKWSAELEKMIQDVQSDTLRFMIFGLLGCALVLLAGLTYYEEVVWIVELVIGICLLVSLVWIVQRWSFLTASWLLVCGVFILILLIQGSGLIDPAFYLLALPAGLATLLISQLAGLTVTGILTLMIFLPLPFLMEISSQEKTIAVILVWGAFGMIWVTFRPLIGTLRWAWFGYKANSDLLMQAQNYQAQLLQTLSQLTDANVQLTRLNQLAQNLRMIAEEERRIKEKFVATVSHELRTPLNMIIGFSEMITQSPQSYGPALPPALLADLKVVLRNSQHLSSLIDDVLDLSQIEAGQMNLMREKVSFASIVDAVTVAVRPLFEMKNLYLKTEIPSDLPEIFCDKKRIREVLLNLLSNAGRFTDSGGVNLRVWQNGNDLLVSVADTGKGINQETQEKLFQPFQQLDVSIRQRYGGTGLGLVISKQFIELHDGKIWVESQEGFGTTFTFRLPIKPLNTIDPGALRWFNPYQPYEERLDRRSQPEVVIPPRLVIVDDGLALSKLLNRLWVNNEIITVNTMNEAAESISECPANLLLVNNSNGDAGLSTAQTELLPEYLPVIALNNIQADTVVSGMGVKDYLLKPISSSSLLGAIDRINKPVKTILLVDDEPDTLQLFSRILASSKRGFRVLRAMNGRQALELLHTENIDVVFLDLTMPDMDGYETLTILNTNPKLRDVSVIVSSAHDPVRGPFTSQSFTVTRQGGLPIHIVIDCLTAISAVFASHGLTAALKPPEMLPG